jgi:hypothetical protein
VSHNRTVAFEPMNAIFPRHVAPVVRQSEDGEREMVLGLHAAGDGKGSHRRRVLAIISYRGEVLSPDIVPSYLQP